MRNDGLIKNARRFYINRPFTRYASYGENEYMIIGTLVKDGKGRFRDETIIHTSLVQEETTKGNTLYVRTRNSIYEVELKEDGDGSD